MNSLKNNFKYNSKNNFKERSDDQETTSHREPEVVCPENATVTKFARLAAGGKLHEAGTCGHIYGEGDTLLTTDYVAIACCYIPYFERYAFLYLLHLVAPLAVGQAAVDEPRALGYAAEL